MSHTTAILAKQFSLAIVQAFGEGYADVEPMITVATNRNFGDYQANLAMGLARSMGRNPREIATEIVAQLDLESICSRVEIAGPGFINLHLNNEFINDQLQLMASDEFMGLHASQSIDRVVVDYSAPNVAKEMHVGHLRSTIIGDAIVRILQALGHEVIRHNHVGDWGTQFGMLIEYLVDEDWQVNRDDQGISDLNKLYQVSKQRFDTDAKFRERARKRVVALQSGDQQSLEYWQYLIDESKHHFNEVYARLGVLLVDEDVKPESFYNPQLAGVIRALDEAGVLKESEGARVVYPEGFLDREGKPMAMIVQKSDGGYLYATTDLAAAYYRIQELQANRLIYVTDARQAQHFAMLFTVLRQISWADNKIKLEHVPFGSVLGPDRKPFKTREGGTINLTNLLDEAEQRARRIIDDKNPDIAEDQRAEVAHIIGIGALKYADLSNDRIKDYVFDWDRMLAMDGNTAPYLQNAWVRIASIFKKGQLTPADFDAGPVVINEIPERELALKLLQFPGTVSDVAEKLEPHRLCTFLYELAAAFHTFYESCPVLKDNTPEAVRDSRLHLCALSARVLQFGLGLLGIQTVEKM